MSRLLEESPEAIKLLEKEVGASKEQFEEMASAGQITVAGPEKRHRQQRG